MSQAEIEALFRSAGHCLDYSPKTVFIHQGQAVEALYWLERGKVKVETTEPNGRSLLLCFMEAPAFLGDVELFRADKAATCTVAAVCTVRLWRLAHATVHQRIAGHPGLSWRLAGSLADKMVAFTRASARNQLWRLEARYAAYLREMAEEGGSLPIRLEETAGLLGSSPRHLQRVVRAFAAAGLVSREGRCLRIRDKTGLLAVEEQG